jgi:hypothetical protein
MIGPSMVLICMPLIVAFGLSDLTRRVLTSDDSDDPIEYVGKKSSSSPSRGKGKQRAAQATKERSITPPPKMSKQALREAVEMAKSIFSEMNGL